MSKKKTLAAPTIESQIESIQRKLAENPPAREFAVLSGQLARLSGVLKPSRQKQWLDKKAEQAVSATEGEPKSLPYQLPEKYHDYWHQKIEQRVLSGYQKVGFHDPTNRTLDRAESAWAQSVGLTVEELREYIRNGTLNAYLYERYPDQYPTPEVIAERQARLYPNGYPKNTAEWQLWDAQHPEETRGFAGLKAAGVTP